MRVRRRSVFPVFSTVAMVASLAVAGGCRDGGHQAPASGLAEAQVKVGSKTYWLEVADTESSREKGLMERDAIGADRGMIFVFDQEAERSFWMHHTRFNLDIVFLDENGRVVSVSSMKAYDEHTTASNGAAKYAIELNEGLARAAGVKEGDVVDLPANIKHRP